jgi:hypothetical protein
VPQARTGALIIPVSADVDTRSASDPAPTPSADLHRDDQLVGLTKAERIDLVATFGLDAVGASLLGLDPGLDLLRGIAHLGVSGGCSRWPRDLLLRWERGQESRYIRGRCKATNKCPYCQRVYVRETVEMLRLDATEYAPTIWSVFTAREHLTRAELNDRLRRMRRELRKSFPDHEYFCQVEFQQRGALHANQLIKGVDPERIDEWYEESTRLWCQMVDAYAAPFDRMETGGQWAGVVQDGVGALLYISKMLAHGLKAEQAPPIGWKGHRTSHTGDARGGPRFAASSGQAAPGRGRDAR